MEKGDRVRVTDGSYAVRVDSYEEYTSIGLCDDVFEVTNYKYDGRLKSDSDTTVHDIFIKNTQTGKIYLHSKAFLRAVTNNPAVDPALIEALKLSIQQWQIMYDTDKSKYQAYKFLGGDTDMTCFLCNFVGVHGGGNRTDCQKCISWNADYCHSSYASPFHDYREDNSSKQAQLKVLNHLKSELSRLDGKQ